MSHFIHTLSGGDSHGWSEGHLHLYFCFILPNTYISNCSVPQLAWGDRLITSFLNVCFQQLGKKLIERFETQFN